MTKKTTKVVAVDGKPEDIMNELIPFPEGYEIKAGFPEEGIRLILNANTMKIYNQTYDALIMSRGIPFNIDSVTFTDPLAIYIGNLQTWNPDPSASARAHYEKLSKDAMGDAFTIALTANVKLANSVTLYDDDNDEDTPEWLKSISAMPKVNKNLKNPVEARLKQLLDVLEDAGLMYRATVVATIEKAMTKALRVAEEAEADESGFQSDGTSGEVHPSDGPTDESDGKEPDNGEKAED